MKKAYNFSLYDQNGKKHTLKDYQGMWVLLYFYPKDDTPGCTKEACQIRDLWKDFKKYNAVVLGVSPDGVDSHKKFEKKYKLPFTLLSDEDKKVMTKFDILGEKSMFGKKYIGVKRESFLINPKGFIVKHYENVKPALHAAEVLSDLASHK